MNYCFDMDGTICATASKNYAEAVPYTDVIRRINSLYEQGHHISIFTARGSSSGIDYHELNISQLNEWGIQYHTLIDKGKPSYDLFIDDKAINASDWRKKEGIKIVGFVASCFDLLHAGHCLYLKEAKSVCDYLIAALQEDPSVDRPMKNKPIQSLEERRIQLESVKYVDEIVTYKTEDELVSLLEKVKPNIRILGSDYRGITVNGYIQCTNIHYHDRNHGWSTSTLRKRCCNERN
jgi:glycerol-3-phosphate cytidylyltransferase